MVLNISYTQKIIAPEIPEYYYSRERLTDKILSFRSKRLILITAPAGYGKTSFSAEFFETLTKELKLWISLSPYDNSIENLFLLLAMAFENNLPNSKFGLKLKGVLSKSQNISLEEKINNVISSFSSDLFSYLNKKNKKLFMFLDDFHNIDESDEVCKALNYFIEYLPSNVNIVFISRREPKKINYPKFLAKNWLGRITKTDLTFNECDIHNFIKLHHKKINSLDKTMLKDLLRSTEGWVTAIQLMLMTNDFDMLKTEDLVQSQTDIFEYFTNEIYELCTEDEKRLLLIMSFTETFNKEIIENVLEVEDGYKILAGLYENNVFISRENETFRFHELLKRFLNKIAVNTLTQDEISNINSRIGNYYLNFKDWREDYIALNYLILGKDYETLKNWIKLNASDKLLLIHSSGLFNMIEAIEDKNFKSSLEYVLLKVNTFIYKDKDIEKSLTYLEKIVRSKFSLAIEDNILIPAKSFKGTDMNYYVEILMLICNCNVLKEGISFSNISLSEHILKFKLRVEQEVQFLVSVIKSYIATGENLKSKKHILRLKDIFNKIVTDHGKGISSIDENSFFESIFSMLIFFDYGDYKTGKKVIRFILNNIDFKSFDLSNYSQACFALFASYNVHDFEIFYNCLKKKNNEKNKTIFSAYKNQYEFQSILRNFLNFKFNDTIKGLEIIKKYTHLKNYIYFIDALILYCYNLIDHPIMINRLMIRGDYHISKTRLLILQLEANLLQNDQASYSQIIKEIEIIKRENFTLFNQAVILYCECYYYAMQNNTKDFRDRFKKFMNLSIEFDYEDYILFRVKANKLKYVFEYASDNKIENVYLKNLFNRNMINLSRNKKRSVNIEIQFLNSNRIFVNDIELSDNLWLRSRSKPIFLYLVYKTFYGTDITKESLIDDILYSSKSVNYEAIVDVEINKVRKTFQLFLSDIFSEKIEKEVIVFKNKKYHLVSKNLTVEIKMDVELFKRLASGTIDDKIKAVEMYKTDFAKDFYQNWMEDIRENLKFIYSDVIHNLVSHFEDKEDNFNVARLLEKLIDIDYNDEDIMMKLLSIYNKEKDFSRFKFIYKIYEKRLKKEFNVKPSKEMQKFFSNVTLNV
ncbi:MAG: AAA family ATPase [Ignavibacteria bacterium]